MRQAGYFIAGDYSGGGVGGGGSGSSGGGGVINCHDCGNRAKKDCTHMRCRTCCKSRGLPCKTHVKSTWVPAAKRRERHQHQNCGNQQLSLMMNSGAAGGGGAADQNIPKRLRAHDHQNIAGDGGAVAGAGVTVLATHHHSTSSGFHFPAEVRSPAVFRCVRVTGLDEMNEQLAYETAVNVGGHVFKGILYDHGPDVQISGASGGQRQNLNLTTPGTTGTTTADATAGVTPAVSFIDPSSIYPTPLCAFMAGTQFFPPPRS